MGTHLVDLVQWTAFPEQAIDVAADIRILEGRRWPLPLTAAQVEMVTGESSYPEGIDYYCNNSVDYILRGAQVRIEAVWNWEAPAGTGDIYTALFRGSRASVDLRQGAAENHRPELYIVPASAALREEVFAAAHRRIAKAQARWPGLDAIETGGELRLTIPEGFRVGHEAHFGQVARRFFEYVRAPGSMPEWERPCMMAKYFVSTKGVENRAFGAICAIIHLPLFVFRRGRAPDRAQDPDKEGVLPDFYEFFAGGGMARAGLGPDWHCLFANDFDPKKGPHLPRELGRCRVKDRRCTNPRHNGHPRARESGLGVIPLPGPFACRRWRRVNGRPLGRILAFLEVD